MPRLLQSIRPHSFKGLAVAAMSLFLTAAPAELRAEDEAQSIAKQLSAAASVKVVQSSTAGDDVNDPLELLNRAIFDINELIQILFLRPASTLYREVVPQPVRNSLGNALDNLSSPVILANDILQGEPERAWQTTQRLAINSTIGVAGLFDAAKRMGIPKHKEDFGQTLAVWGIGEGFYLVLPIFGPSNPRDAVGKLLIDGYFDPLNVWLDNSNRDAIANTRTGVGGVDEYEGVMDELESLQKTSIDYYSVLRSLYRQKRASEIKNGSDADLPPVPDIEYLDLSLQNEDSAGD